MVHDRDAAAVADQCPSQLLRFLRSEDQTDLADDRRQRDKHALLAVVADHHLADLICERCRREVRAEVRADRIVVLLRSEHDRRGAAQPCNLCLLIRCRPAFVAAGIIRRHGRNPCPGAASTNFGSDVEPPHPHPPATMIDA